ncbi:pantoate--beta-alanine ligase [Pseudomonas sp. F1_0610]|uniref:pantoate--beta-alanine ligase n=1 Tax=Pseudomonas sp. F1_0610 TaxID=3114284 RepID=UPI0039C1E147
MKTITSVQEIRTVIAQARRQGKRIGLVPTMGNLHQGHMSLIQKACEYADFVVASIFVNPLQFGINEDLDSYPRTLEQDQEKLRAAGCSLLFHPNVEEMYPTGMQEQTLVHVPSVSAGLCGAKRPGHFDGVATVVSKLFNIVQPDIAVFGEKDFQQLAVIRKLVADMNLPIQVFGAPIVRAEDGLALSSRNQYLTTEQRASAPALHNALVQLVDSILHGETDFTKLIETTNKALSNVGFKPDYLEIRDELTLEPATTNTKQGVVLAAAYLGSTRLIDNLTYHLN